MVPCLVQCKEEALYSPLDIVLHPKESDYFQSNHIIPIHGIMVQQEALSDNDATSFSRSSTTATSPTSVYCDTEPELVDSDPDPDRMVAVSLSQTLSTALTFSKEVTTATSPTLERTVPSLQKRNASKDHAAVSHPCGSLQEDTTDTNDCLIDERFVEPRSRRNVSFGTVTISSHEIYLGDSPSVSAGPPIQIQWTAFETVSLSIDEFESTLEHRRCKAELQMPPYVRSEILLRAGYSRLELFRATKQSKHARTKIGKSALIYINQDRHWWWWLSRSGLIDCSSRKMEQNILANTKTNSCSSTMGTLSYANR